MRKIVPIVLLLAVFFFGALFLMNSLWPTPAPGRRPALAAIPPLEPVTRSSVIVAPVWVAQSAIRDALEAQAPRNLAGKKDNPFQQLLSNADFGWTVTRSRSGHRALRRANGVDRAQRHAACDRRNRQYRRKHRRRLTGALGDLVNQKFGQNLQRLTGKTIDQRADFRGNVTVSARPAVTPDWRIEPNPTGQVSLADASLSVVGVPDQCRQ
jgi:hypothetical protein